MMCLESLTVWVAVASAPFAGVGLVLNVCALRASTRQRNLDLFVQYYHRVVDIVDRLTEAGAAKDDQEVQRNVLALSVELEAFAFLINTGHLDDSKMVGFWKPTLLGWHEELFPRFIPDWNNPKNYIEFKRLCRRLEGTTNGDACDT